LISDQLSTTGRCAGPRRNSPTSNGTSSVANRKPARIEQAFDGDADLELRQHCADAEVAAMSEGQMRGLGLKACSGSASGRSMSKRRVGKTPLVAVGRARETHNFGLGPAARRPRHALRRWCGAAHVGGAV